MIKVVLVDDDTTVRNAMLHSLEWKELGVQVIGSYSNAIEALDKMINDMPDILITDVKMPVMNGIELIQRAKKMHPFLKCVILSGYDEFPLAQAAMLEGVRHYLLKPYTKDKIEKIIREIVAWIEKEKKTMLEDDNLRSAVIGKTITDLLDLVSEKEEIERTSVENIILSDRNAELSKEIAVTLILRCYSENNSQKAIRLISEIYNGKENIINNVIYTLYDFRKTLQNEYSFIERMKMYVDENYVNEDLSLKYVAENVIYMNAKYAGKQFQKKVGMKFSDYLLEVRMKQAKILIERGEKYKMYEIAEKVGLGNNIQYFYQLFKRYTGMTPKEYQEHSIL